MAEYTDSHIRNVPVDTLRKIKAAAALKGITMGAVFVEALELWLEREAT